MRISEAGIDQEFTVKSVLLAHEVGRRLADMGFTEGAQGKVVRRGMFHGPLQIRIRDYDVLIRRCEAAGIEVDPIGEISADMGPGNGAFIHGGFPGRRHHGFSRGRHGGRWNAGGSAAFEAEPTVPGGEPK